MRIEQAPSVNHPDIILRQLEESDLSDWFNYLSIPEVYQDTSWDLSSVNDLNPSYQLCISPAVNSNIRLAIVDSITNSLIGSVGFHTISAVNKSAEIAYDLSPAYWGKGIGAMICDTVTQWGFSAMGWQRIQATTLETNLKSEKVLIKCGFKYEGLLRSYRMVRGVPGNFKMYARVKGDQF